ncbi:MAG: DNA translocase FtsK 4TM domain-containing protein [Proteobacteria bacterium]|nr:DNA translocase FtsK 4TM domain-containing protein [Pseudomonadota bacterium]
MGKAVRKIEKAPRKRLIAEPPPLVKKASAADSWEIPSVILLMLAIFLSIALYSELHITSLENTKELFSIHNLNSQNTMGKVGSLLANILLQLFGYCSFVIVGWVLLFARKLALPNQTKSENPLMVFCGVSIFSVVLISSCATLAAIFYGYIGGGIVGTKMALKLISYVNKAGTVLVTLSILLISLSLATGFSTNRIFSFYKKLFAWSLRFFSVSAQAAWENSDTIPDSLFKLGRAMYLILAAPLLFWKEKKLLASSSQQERKVKTLNMPFTMGEAAEVATPKKAKRLELKEEPEPLEDEEAEEDIAEIEDKIIKELKINRKESILLKPSEAKEKLSIFRKNQKLKQKKVEVQEDVDFQIPSPEMLVRSESSLKFGPRDEELITNSKRLEQTLLNFKIGGKVVEVQPGPVITLYEFEPAAGVKVQKLINLADDLALSLKVASVRVYAPVPGKGTVGIEVPNSNREIVRLRDLIESPAFMDKQQQIALALGKDTFGDPFISDLAKMPHLLIAGATGTGKSVCINSLILSLLYRNTPNDLRLIMIDPKMLELSVYEDIPHLKAPVVTQAKRARGVLWWAVEEMERRYTLMKDSGVRNLASYNSLVSSNKIPKVEKDKEEKKVIELLEKDVIATSAENAPLDRENSTDMFGESKNSFIASHHEPLPRIVIIVDELADLMLTVGKEIEELLTRLAQKARAAGIHLILATQRPSVNVITGLIKANFPSRISFKVASRIDARTVLDSSGSEKLLGQGDMLFLSPGAGKPRRLHSPFVSDKEVHDVVEWLRKQGKPVYDEHIQAMIDRIEEGENNSVNGNLMSIDGTGNQEYDELYDQAVSIVVEKGFASTSMVQRVFRIGYNRAARILETMEKEGIVGPADGAKPRQVLIGGAEREGGY